MFKIIEGITVGQIQADMEAAEREGFRYAGAMTGQSGSIVIMHRPEIYPRQWVLSRVAELLREAVEIDGAHHKQWYLEQVAEGLEVTLPNHEPGIAP